MNAFLGNKNDILKELNVDINIGLNEEARKLSLEKYGINSFTKNKELTLIQNIMYAFKEPMI